jgi:hypothetical protein
MRISNALFVAIVVLSSAVPCLAQSGPGGAPTQATPAAPLAPSAILQPGIDSVKQTLGVLKLEKWKKGTVRDEAGSNLDAIQRDIKGTLSELLKTADAAPATISKVLPVSRNVDAVYDVLVHVYEAARVSAPGDQIGQLQQAMTSLEKARVALDDQLQQTAATQEKQLADLHSTVQTQAASLHAIAATPPPPPCPKPATAPKKKRVTPATPPKTASPPTTSTTPAPKTP